MCDSGYPDLQRIHFCNPTVHFLIAVGAGTWNIKLDNCLTSQQLCADYTRRRMFTLRVILGLMLTVWSASAGSMVFEDSDNPSIDQQTNTATRNGAFDDSVVVEAAGAPGGEVDSRFLGLFGGE